MLKRKLDESVDDGGEPENVTRSNGHSESDDSNCSAGSTDALAPEVASGPSPPKRMKKNVNFKGVTVFYFPRRQGFTCVPSEGGSTLGMSEKHSFTRDFTLSDYTKEQKRSHRAILAEQRRQGKLFPSPLLASSLPPPGTEEDVSSGSESDSEYDDYYFLQPLPIRQRRVLLRTAGVKKIDNDEKDECRDIRVSRNVCGCDCKLFCDPATCSCSLAGIQCQVDRLSFPCGCTKDGCGNPAGRIEFNPIRVRTHFIHTLMRLELERKDSECPQGSSAATTTSCFSPKSLSTGGEIDVVGAIGEEGEIISPEMTDGGSDDSCSGASIDAGTSSGIKVLKSRLKAKRAEMIDLNMFNSNERGSCRDCQNTDMCNVMMHDVKFSMVTQQQRQQQHVIATTLGSQAGYPGTLGPQMQQHHHLGLSPGISPLHSPAPLPPPQQQQKSRQHMLLFNDGGEEEVYQAENTTSMYFDIDDNSYSEISDPSPDALETQSFSSLTQAGFSGKFHISQAQMFAATGISTANSNSNGTLHSQTPTMSGQTSLLNSNCLQSRQMNGVGNSSSPISCNTIRLEQQRSCGLMVQPHARQTSTAAPSRSLLRPPFLPGVLPLPSGHCVGSEGILTSSAGLPPQSGLLTCAQMENSLKLGVSDSNVILPGVASSFQNKFARTEMLRTTGHTTPSTYKLESPVFPNQNYSPSSSCVTGADYLSQPCNSNFSSQTAESFGNLTTSAVSNDSSISFQALQNVQHSSCWSTSVTNPSTREHFELGTSAAAVPSPANQPALPGDISCSSSYEEDSEPCAVALSLASTCSSTTTYTTMTTTTHDRLAAHCPGISSHVDGRPELSTSILKDSAPSFSTYQMTDMDSDTSNIVGTSQNLLFDLSYPGTSTTQSHVSLPVTCTSAEINRQSSDPEKDNFLNESSPLSPSTVSSPLTLELLSTAPLYSDEVSSTTLPSSLPSLSLITPTPSSSSSENYQTAVKGPSSLSQLSESTKISGLSEHTSFIFSEDPYSQRNTSPNVTSATGETTERENTLENRELQNATSEHQDLNDAHADLKAKPSWKEEREADCSWGEDEDHLKDVQSEKLSCAAPSEDYEPESTGRVSSLALSTLQSAISSSLSSSSVSSSSPTASTEGDKEKSVSPDFGEIIKESIVEMVAV